MATGQYMDNNDSYEYQPAHLVFGYKSYPCDGCSTYPGYSIKIYDNNMIELLEYCGSDDSSRLETSVTPISGIRFEGNQRDIEHVIRIVDSHAATIEAMPNELLYDIYDGSIDIFMFRNKVIRADNIYWCDLLEMKNKYKVEAQSLEMMKNGNRLLEIYNAIARALYQYDFFKEVDRQTNHFPLFGSAVKEICGVGMSEVILQSIILDLFGRIASAGVDADKHANDAYYQGKNDAYRDVIRMLADSMETNGIDSTDYGFDQIE